MIVLSGASAEGQRNGACRSQKHDAQAAADQLSRARYLYEPASGRLLRGDFAVFSGIDLR